MKPIYLTLLCYLFYSVPSFAQNDSISIGNDELSALLNKYYIKYSAGQETTTSSSFAGLDIEKTTFTFSPSFVTKNANVWSAKFEGGITDGIASVFNNNKFNTNLGAELQYSINLANKDKRKIYGYMEDDYVKYRKDKIECLTNNIKEIKEFISKNGLNKNDILNRIDNFLKTEEEVVPTDELKNREDRLLKFYKTLNKELTSFENIESKKQELILDKFNVMSNKIADISKKRVTEFKFTRFNTKWFTVAVIVRNDDFRLLDRSALFENQIEKSNYITFGTKVQYNNYLYKKHGNSHFYNFGLKYLNKNNIDGLKKVELEDNDIVGTNTTITRKSNNKYTAYEGLYKENMDQLNLNADFFYFINKWQNIGLHVYENTIFSESLKPAHDLGFGIVIPFKNKKEDNTIINAEIYYTLKNIFNTEDINYGLVERNDIGLRFTFPIDFNFN